MKRVVFLTGSLLAFSGPVNAAVFAVIQTTSSAISASGSVISSTFPANTGSGNLIAVAVNMGTAGSTVSNVHLGSTLFTQPSPSVACTDTNSGTGDIWYLLNSPSGQKAVTVNFTAASTFTAMFAWEVSGVKTASAFDVGGHVDNQTASTTPLGAAVTITASGDFIAANINPQTAITAMHAGNEFTWDDSLKKFTGGAHITSTSASIGSHQPQWDTTSGTFCACTAAFFVQQNTGGGGKMDRLNLLE